MKGYRGVPLKMVLNIRQNLPNIGKLNPSKLLQVFNI